MLNRIFLFFVLIICSCCTRSTTSTSSKVNRQLDMLTEQNVWPVKEVEKLLKAGESPNIIDKYGEPLLISCVHKDELVELLVKYGADPNVLSTDGDTPLIHALNELRFDAVENLLKCKSSPFVLGKGGYNALTKARNENYDKVVNLFINYYKLHNEPKPEMNDWPPICIYAWNGDLDLLKKELEVKRVDINTRDNFSYTPFLRAVDRNKIDIVKYLITKNADVNIQLETGATALHIAAIRKNSQMLELLLKSNVNPHLKTKDGDTYKEFL